ncbi:MAG: IS3 family transposase [Fusobacterium sp.]|uniref:IS3 family transposase n=1 Tax=Fusobacterium sp. TaxID=68766 RepID=UPI002A75032A|nr:IS3 family transposase [Fusobacterium sp.]MDY2980007.1 IS3 family transposase [Fusobacterium sp.]
MAKLTKEQKIEMFEQRLKGETLKNLSLKFNLNESKIKYLIALINKHGYNILRNNKNRYYSKEFKETAINRVLMRKESINSVAVDIGLSSSGILDNWIKKFKENCYNVIENKRGRKSKTMTKLKKSKKILTKEDKIKDLEREILYLKAENEYLKKLNALVQEEELGKEQRVRIITELRAKYPLKLLLKISGIARATYYFYINKKDKDLKNQDIIDKIKEIFYANKKRYGYRRITLELKNQGININHKKVSRLMKKLNLQSITRKRKRKYSSYQGTVGKIADNHIERNFEANRPNEKWFTDVTEFNLRGTKLYLSPILDAYGRYIISYNLSLSPNFNQIIDMLEKAFKDNFNINNLIFHSDQGWQYQHNFYTKRLEEKNIIQSMSRKGNSLDNGLMESFFGIMKSEMFYGQEKNYKNIEELKLAIEEYIDYYNNKRIKVKLKGLTPASYRNQSLLINN